MKRTKQLTLAAAAALFFVGAGPLYATGGGGQDHTCQGGHNCNEGGGGSQEQNQSQQSTNLNLNNNNNTAIGEGGEGGKGGDGGDSWSYSEGGEGGKGGKGGNADANAEGGNATGIGVGEGGDASATGGIGQGGNATGGSVGDVTGGNSSSSSTASSSSTSSSSSSSAVDNSGNSANTITFEAPEIPVDTAYAPSFQPTAPCRSGVGAGVQTRDWGVSFGGSPSDEECNGRAGVKLLHELWKSTKDEDFYRAMKGTVLQLEAVQKGLEYADQIENGGASETEVSTRTNYRGSSFQGGGR